MCALLVVACGANAPSPVQPPPNFSSDAQVVALLERKLARVQSDPSNAVAHRSLGLVYGSNGAWDLASQCFRNALELEPDDVHAGHELARSLGREGDLDGRLECLIGLVERHPDFLAARLDLGVEWLERDRLGDAQVQFQTIADQRQDLPLGYIGLGEVALAQGQAQKALEQFKVALRLAPNEDYVRFQMGQAYLDLGNEKRAKPLMELGAGAKRPTYSTPSSKEMLDYKVARGDRLAQAVKQLVNGQTGKAIRTLEALRDLDPKDTLCLNNLAVGYLRTRRFDDALGVLEVILELDPEQQGIRMNQASCYMQMGHIQRKNGNLPGAQENLQKALDAVDLSLGHDPTSGLGHVMRGRILNSLGRRGDAVKAIRSGIDHGRASEEAYALLAEVVEAHSGLGAAAEVLKEGLRRPGIRLELHFQLVGMLLKMDRGREARECHARMVELAPKDERTIKAHRVLKARGL